MYNKTLWKHIKILIMTMVVDLSEGFFLLKLFYNVNITYTIKYFWKK